MAFTPTFQDEKLYDHLDFEEHDTLDLNLEEKWNIDKDPDTIANYIDLQYRPTPHVFVLQFEIPKGPKGAKAEYFIPMVDAKWIDILRTVYQFYVWAWQKYEYSHPRSIFSGIACQKNAESNGIVYLWTANINKGKVVNYAACLPEIKRIMGREVEDYIGHDTQNPVGQTILNSGLKWECFMNPDPDKHGNYGRMSSEVVSELKNLHSKRLVRHPMFLRTYFPDNTVFFGDQAIFLPVLDTSAIGIIRSIHQVWRFVQGCANSQKRGIGSNPMRQVKGIFQADHHGCVWTLDYRNEGF